MGGGQGGAGGTVSGDREGLGPPCGDRDRLGAWCGGDREGLGAWCGDREGLGPWCWGDRADFLDGQLGEGLWKADVSRDKGISSRSGRRAFHRRRL